MKRIILCSVVSAALAGGCTPVTPGEPPSEEALAIFHNGSGPMCLEALEWLDTMQSEHPDLVVEEYLTTNAANLVLLSQLKSQYAQSQGVSTTFGYLPIIFFGGQAFSGFNTEIRDSLEGLIASAETSSP